MLIKDNLSIDNLHYAYVSHTKSQTIALLHKHLKEQTWSEIMSFIHMLIKLLEARYRALRQRYKVAALLQKCYLVR